MNYYESDSLIERFILAQKLSDLSREEFLVAVGVIEFLLQIEDDDGKV
jgi:hypothetical protein